MVMSYEGSNPTLWSAVSGDLTYPLRLQSQISRPPAGVTGLPDF